MWASVYLLKTKAQLHCRGRSVGRCIPASSTACIDLLSNAAVLWSNSIFQKVQPSNILCLKMCLKAKYYVHSIRSGLEKTSVIKQTGLCHITYISNRKCCNYVQNQGWNWHSLSKSVVFEKWRKWVLDQCETWAGLHMVMVLVVRHGSKRALEFPHIWKLLCN